MAEEPEYTIGELAQRAGVTPRTIRYYTAEGLLPQPDTRDRYARYGAGHLQRLRQIAELKAHYLPLNVIRERLGAPPPAPAPRPPSPLTLAAPGLQQEPQPPAPTGAGSVTMTAGERHVEASPLRLGHYEFFPHGPELAEKAADERADPAEHWRRVTLTPGVELHFREPLSPRRRRQIEALIAAARDQLRGDDE